MVKNTFARSAFSWAVTWLPRPGECWFTMTSVDWTRPFVFSRRLQNKYFFSFFASGTYIKLTGVWRQIDWCKFRPNSTNRSRVINVFWPANSTRSDYSSQSERYGSKWLFWLVWGEPLAHVHTYSIVYMYVCMHICTCMYVCIPYPPIKLQN